MRVVLSGGPRDCVEVNVSPNTLEYLVALPRPIDILYPFDQPVDANPNYDIAIYRFMGIGFVNLDGACTALVFQYQGTSHAS